MVYLDLGKRGTCDAFGAGASEKMLLDVKDNDR